MTEKLKTRSEVLAGLEALKEAMDPLVSSFERVEIWGGDEIRIDHFTLAVVHEDGSTVWYSESLKFSPDPDTKKQAFEKACGEARKLLFLIDESSGSAPIQHDAKKRFFRCTKEGEEFTYGDPTPKSEFITDEPPPDFAPVEVSILKGKILRYSRAKFCGGCLKVTDMVDQNGYDVGNTDVFSSYRSLTTPHRSKDWVD